MSDYKGEHVSEHSIDQGRERFLEAWLTNDPDALMRELDDDVVFMPPGHEPARGKSAVRAWFEAAIAESTTVSLQIPEREVVVAGDWGIESGSFAWTLSPVGGGEQLAARGSFVTIWRRDSRGEWRVASGPFDIRARDVRVPLRR